MILDAAVKKVLNTAKGFVVKSVLEVFSPPEPLDYDLICVNIKSRAEAICKDLISDEYAHNLELRL